MKQLEGELAMLQSGAQDRESLLAESSRVKKVKAPAENQRLLLIRGVQALARMWREMCLYVDEASTTKALGAPLTVSSQEVARLQQGWELALKVHPELYS